MRKTITYLTAFFLVFTSIVFSNITPIYANTKTKTRTINIVYDDSRSMVLDGSTSWSQAKYAMKVFAAMMGEEDKINIYPMTSFATKGDGNKSDSWGTVISMTGKDSPDSRVDKIEKMNGDNSKFWDTPIGSVEAAGNALASDTSNEKWLVILTDGNQFYRDGQVIGADETRNVILQYAGKNNINVAYVSIGNGAINLISDSSKDHFYPFATDSDHILDTVTEVGQLVYNYQSIPLSGNGPSYSFNADIPLSKVIIFAQGKDANAENLQVGEKNVSGNQSSVHVEISKDTPYVPTNGDPDPQFGDNLNGRLVTYQAKNDKKPFQSGKFTFDSNVKDVKVFFEPGVDVQTVLVDGNGEKIDLSKKKIPDIQAGEKTVEIKIVNPLTGETINPEDSELLQGATLHFSIVDKDGNITECGNGDKIVFPEGDVEVYSTARFAGDIEKNSEIKSIHVEPGGLNVSFASKSYDVDLVTSKVSEDILVDITSGDGSPITEEEYKTLEYKVKGFEGIEWKLEPTDKQGRYKLIPEIKDDKKVKEGKHSIEMTCTLTSSGVNKKGSAKVKIVGTADTELELVLKLTLPDETIEGKDRKYMFDPNVRGANKDAPYIKVEVQAQNQDGTTRPLTEEEWELGLEGFSFSSKNHNGNILWKIIGIICRQRLNFEAVKGDEVSTYKLYLSGLTVGEIRPNESDLETTLTITMPSGIKEIGKSNDVVSVMPAGLWVYIGRFVMILIAVLLALAFIIMELTKKRFDRRMYPNTIVLGEQHGLADPHTEPEVCTLKPKYRILPPWKAEEATLRMSYTGYMAEINFHVRAERGGRFVITDPEAFQDTGVSFGGKDYDVAVKEGKVILGIGTKIHVPIADFTFNGEAVMSFIDPDHKHRARRRFLFFRW